MRKIILFNLLLLNTVILFATHQRAGEITYTHEGGLTYKFTITTYTYAPSPADRPEIEVLWGDGTGSMITRSVEQFLGNDIKLSQYVASHTFPAVGSYSITFEDPNRNAGIVNIPNSVNIPFFLETILVIHPFLGSNSSPQLQTQPIDNGCTNVPFYHNPGAYDPDGDSLAYSLIYCRGYEGVEIPGYSYPSAANSITIDPYTGEFAWDYPLITGEYNIAILIREFRNGVFIGSVVRDMQITIAPCNNQPPEITAYDTCVVAGERLRLPVIAIDDKATNRVTLSATGHPFRLSYSPAVFDPITDFPPVTGIFNWETHCTHVKKEAYQVLFRAVDSDPQVALTTYKTINIKVIAPEPENLMATPLGNMIHLEWDASICTNVIGYKIYKRRGSNPFEPEYCQTGMPPDKGYQLIGTTDGLTTTAFIDDGSVMPIYHNNEYCYRVVAYFADGAESYVSDEVCSAIFSDAPRLIHVDVLTTDSLTGEIFIQWIAPSEIDSMIFPPPYEYRLKRKSDDEPSFIQLHTSSEPSSYQDQFLNTAALTYTYMIELWSLAGDEPILIENSDPANSVFISIGAFDKMLRLTWNEETPWVNTSYTIYRYNEELSVFDSIGVTENHFYDDRDLENGKRYCYYIRSEGGYFFPDTIFPLYNRSQENCNVPIDTVPPELPTVAMTTDCETIEVSWNYDDPLLYEDVGVYTIYYKPSYQQEYEPLVTFENPGRDCYFQNCYYTIDQLDVIIGCLALTVTDTTGNESALSDTICFDYDECIYYTLPNVFTPNGDGFNDLFIPFPYKNISKVSMIIHNRYGRIVFKTEDPNINWDGKDHLTHLPCSEGQYYYSCEIFIQALTGVVSKKIHGSITLTR